MATLGLKEMGKFLWEGRENEGERNGHWIDILRYLFPLYSHLPNKRACLLSTSYLLTKPLQIQNHAKTSYIKVLRLLKWILLHSLCCVPHPNFYQFRKKRKEVCRNTLSKYIQGWRNWVCQDVQVHLYILPKYRSKNFSFLRPCITYYVTS